MWLFTTVGFFSVVQKKDESGLTVRARVASDLEQLREKYMPTLSATKKHAGTDYPFRATIGHDEFAEGFAQIVKDISYSNFKDEVGKRFGHDRASIYTKVWSVLLDLENHSAMELGATYKTAKPPTSQGSGKAKAYGAVVIDADGRVLLREPTDHYDEYVWTFAKGRPNLGETPEETARREVKEETGIAGTIVVPIPGEFEGGTTVNLFFLASPVGEPGPWGKETAQIRWVTEEEAKDLIGKTTNKTGRPRDLAILKAAFAVYLGQPSKS